MAKSFSHQRGGLRLSDQQRKAATIWYNWYAGGGGGGTGLPAKGSFMWTWLSDSHSAQNEGLSGQTDPLAYAYTSLPADVKANKIVNILGGDFWNANHITQADGEGVADEIAQMGADVSFGLEGNHDWYNDFFHDYVDPLAENGGTSGRDSGNFPIAPVGDRRCYYLRKGNLMLLCIGDNQDFNGLQGEADLVTKIYNAAGGYSSASWRAFIKYVLSNLDCNIIIHTHHPLKDTTVGSGFFESVTAGVAWLDMTQSAQADFEVFRGSYMAFIENKLAEKQFEDFYTSIYGFPVLYLHGHIHVQIDEIINGRSFYETKYGIPHMNGAVVADKLFNPSFRPSITPSTRVLNAEGKTLNIKTHVHISDGTRSTGYQSDLEKNIIMPYNYNEDYTSDDPEVPSTPSITSISVDEKGCATINVSTSADGVLIVRRKGAHTTFTPTADTAYLRDDTAGDGVVVHMGPVKSFRDYGVFSGDQYYSVWSFNGRNDKITFSALPSQQVATIVAADQSKILDELSLDGGQTVVYLDSRVGITNNSGVQTWADQSGNGLDATQATQANRPAYDTDSNRIAFTVSGQKYLSIANNALHYFGHSTSTWLIDVPFGIFAKIKMVDATTFRICSKIGSNTSGEFLLCTTATDLVGLFLYDAVSDTLANSIAMTTNAATSLQDKDLFVFANYEGGKKLSLGGGTLEVYDKDKALVLSATSYPTGGTYSKIREEALGIDIGRQNTSTPDYSEGEINGIIIKRGKVFTPQEKVYIMDHFTFSDDV